MANGIVLNIDTTKSEFQNPMVQLRQGDGNYQSLDVTVTSNGEPLDLTGWTVTFMGTTAGGFKIVDSAVTVTNALQGEFTYTPTKAWGQDQGEFKNAYFKFTKADETASGALFRVNVLDAVDLTAEEAGDYISIVDQTINKLSGDLSTLQTSVDQLKAQNNAIKTTDNTWTGTNTFNKRLIAQAGVQGNADSATKLQTPRKINGTNFDGTADINVNAANDSNLVHNTGNESVSGDKQFNGSITFTEENTFLKPIVGSVSTRMLTEKNLNTVASNISNYIGEWYGGTDETTGGLANGYPISDNGYWYFKIAALPNGRGYIEANFNYSNRTFIASVRNNTIISWVEIPDKSGSNTFNGDLTVNGTIKAGSITATSGSYTVITDYVGEY